MMSMLEQLEACSGARLTDNRRRGLKGSPNSVYEKKLTTRFKENWKTEEVITTSQANEILKWGNNKYVLGALRRLEELGYVVRRATVRVKGASTPTITWQKSK